MGKERKNDKEKEKIRFIKEGVSERDRTKREER